jgi:hypothetical protein
MTSEAGAVASAGEQAIWPLDPTELAVEASRWRPRDELPGPFCVELGRRLLLAQFEYSEWILRRVDKVDLERDRSVSRRTTIELTIRHDAPVFTESDGTRLRLVPLAVMRRQTMVNLDLRDESGGAVTIPGIRLVQQLDQSILLAAAAALDPAAACDPAVRRFVREAVAGSLEQVRYAYERFDPSAATSRKPWKALPAPPPAPDDSSEWLRKLTRDPLFQAAASRLKHNFTLYTFFREDQSRHRLIHMSFDEPTSWLYQRPGLVGPTEDRPFVTYQPGPPKRISIGRAWAGMGFAATRIRFQTPAAETAASYHFEISAPAGVQIVRATLLAGRPNDVERHVSLDRIVGHSPIVGLHAVEVPNGSLCRVQVDLRAPSRGWLTTILVGAAAVLAVTASTCWHWFRGDPHWTPDQITNLVLLLVTTSAAVATLVAQRDSGAVGSRFVAGVRAFGTLAIMTPVAASGVLAYSGLHDSPVTSVNPRAHWIHYALLGLTALAAVLFVLILAAWLCSAVADGRAVIEESPWDMTRHSERGPRPWRRRKTRRRHQRLCRAEKNYNAAVETFRFGSLAVGVRSAEGWHTTYAWTDEKQGDAIDALRRLAPSTRTGTSSGCRWFQTECAVRHDCRHVRLAGADRPWAAGSGPRPS